jgi:uncharacterized RmlC-like cupin family protein
LPEGHPDSWAEIVDVSWASARRRRRRSAEHGRDPAPSARPVRRLDRESGPLSFGALRSIAAGVAAGQRALPVGDGEPSAPRAQRLLGTALYDVWVVTWPDGSGEDYHGHGGVRSVLHVIEGELIEIYSDNVDELAPGARVLRTGDSIYAKPSFAHDLANRCGADATTLHVYSPPLLRVTTVEPPAPGESERLRSVAAGRRFRQARAHHEPALRLPPLALVHPPSPAARGSLPGGVVAPESERTALTRS